MNTLNMTLKAVLPRVDDLGGDGTTVNRDRLIGALEALKRDLDRIFYVRLGVALALILLLVILMIVFYRESTAFAAFSAGTGLSIGGAVAFTKQVTDEMTRTRLLLAIAPDLSLEALTELAQKLSSGLGVQ